MLILDRHILFWRSGGLILEVKGLKYSGSQLLWLNRQEVFASLLTKSNVFCMTSIDLAIS